MTSTIYHLIELVELPGKVEISDNAIRVVDNGTILEVEIKDNYVRIYMRNDYVAHLEKILCNQ